MSQMHAEDDSLLTRGQKPAVSAGEVATSVVRPSDTASGSIRPRTTPLSDDEAKAHMEAFRAKRAAGKPPVGTQMQNGVSRPGEAMIERAQFATGSTTASNIGKSFADVGEKAFEANTSSVASSVHKQLATATGFNAQELTNHAANTARIAGALALRNDPKRQAAAAEARERDINRSDEMDSAVGSWKDAHADGAPEESADEKKTKARAALGSTFRKVSANLRLSAADKAIGNQGVDEWKMKHTVGEEAPERYSPGDVISKDDREQGSTYGSAKRLAQGAVSSLVGGTSTLGDTTKLSDEEKAKIAKTKERTAAVHEAREERNENREVSGSIGGTMKRAGAAAISSLVGGTQSLTTVAKLTDEEKAKIADTKVETKEVKEAAKARADARPKGSILTQAGNFFGSLGPSSTRALGDTREYDDETQSKVDATKAEAQKIHDAAKARGGFITKYTTEEQRQLDAIRTERKQVKSEAAGGLTKEEQERVDTARSARKEVYQVAAGGNTNAETKELESARSDRKKVKDDARNEADYMGRHDGQTVSKFGRAGGVNSSDSVTAEEMETTLGGTAAQGLRAGGQAIGTTGRVIGGRSKDADAAIRKGNLAEAGAITASGVTSQVGSIVATTMGVPGVGTAVKAAGQIVSGTGGMAEAAGDHLAQGQDQRDRTRGVQDGSRRDATRGQAVNWTGSAKDQDKAPIVNFKEAASLTKAGLDESGITDMVTDHAKDLARETLPAAVAEHVVPAEEPAPEPEEPKVDASGAYDGEARESPKALKTPDAPISGTISDPGPTPAPSPRPEPGPTPAPDPRADHLAAIRAKGSESTSLQADKVHRATTPVADVTKKEYNTLGSRLRRFGRNTMLGVKKGWKRFKGFFGGGG